MRTKTLLIAAAALAASALSSLAQSNVYSVNVVGYMNKQVPANNGGSPTFTGVANQLDTGSNTLLNLVQALPNGSKVLKWNYAGQTYNTFTRTAIGAGWSPTGSGSNTINLGEGAFLQLNTGNANPFTNTFVGQVFQGDGVTTVSFTNVLLPGLSFYSFPVPLDQVAVSNVLVGLSAALPPNPSGSKIQFWNEVSQSGFTVFTRTAIGSGWSPSVPLLSAGQSFFINNAASTNRLWIINFTVPSQ